VPTESTVSLNFTLRVFAELRHAPRAKAFMLMLISKLFICATFRSGAPCGGHVGNFKSLLPRTNLSSVIRPHISNESRSYDSYGFPTGILAFVSVKSMGRPLKRAAAAAMCEGLRLVRSERSITAITVSAMSRAVLASHPGRNSLSH
jgi:hypothetical protein